MQPLVATVALVVVLPVTYFLFQLASTAVELTNWVIHAVASPVSSDHR